MALKVIGSGFGRTGTMSTKTALEQLGFGPCHHMIEVIGNPAQPAHWKAVASGKKADWAEIFSGYNSQVDWPGAAVWRETSIAFPDAKVVHTERPEGEWWNSFSVTIGKFFTLAPSMPLPPEIAEIIKTMYDWFIKDTFEDLLDRDSTITAYRANNQKVRDTIPAERLLVFNVAEGWGPLCRFLQVPEPETPFPRSHPRDEFWAHFGGEPS
jgi:Sulfotransferase domain